MGTDREAEAANQMHALRFEIAEQIEELLREVNSVPNVNFARGPLAKALKVLRDPNAIVISSPVAREVRAQLNEAER